MIRKSAVTAQDTYIGWQNSVDKALFGHLHELRSTFELILKDIATSDFFSGKVINNLSSKIRYLAVNSENKALRYLDL